MKEDGKVKLVYLILYWILLIAGIIIFSPLIILGFLLYFIFMIIPSPIERKIYKKSSYFKKFDVKYRVGIIYDFRYKLYEQLLKNYENVKSYNLDNYSTIILIYKEKIFIIVADYQIYFDKEDEKWKIDHFEYDDSPIKEETCDEHLEFIPSDLNEYLYHELDINCINYENKKLIVLANYYALEGSLKQAKEDERFLIYNNDKSLFKKLESIFKEE